MDDEQRRIRSYLEAQAAKLGPAALVDKVRVAMQELRSAAAAVPRARFDDRPAAEEWSANEVMAHVVDSGARFGARVVEALAGAPQGPRVEDAIEPDAPRRTAAEWCARLDREREELFARVLAADPDARLDRVIEHPMFGPLNWRETILFLRLHDLDHAGQLRKIAEAFGAAS